MKHSWWAFFDILKGMRLFHLLLLGLCLFLFTASATTDLALPGPHDDEVEHACLAIDLMRPPHPLGDYSLHWGGQPLPFGVCLHTGALKAYMLWPLFVLFGPSVALMRLFTIFLGLLTLLFFYLFARDVFGPWPAILGLLFMSVDSAFLYYSKLDAGPIVEQLMWMMIGLWSFTQWQKRKKTFYLFIVLLSVLLGIYSHIAFIWIILACVVSGLLFYRDEFLKLFRRPAVYPVIFAALSIVAIFLYWLVGEKEWLLLAPPGFSGAFVMFEHISTMGGIVPDVLMGKFFEGIPPFPIKARPLTDIFLIVSIIFLILRYRIQPKGVRFFMVLSGTILLQLLWTPGSFVIYPHRMMVFYLFLVLFGGIAMAQSVNILGHFRTESLRRKVASFGILILAIVSLFGQVTLKQEVDEKIREGGGKGTWSDAMYTLADAIEQGDWEEVICLDWGLHRPLFFLTTGKIFITEPPWNVRADIGTKRRLLSQMLQKATPRTLFLLPPHRTGPVGVLIRDFIEVAQDIEEEPKLRRLFYDREGDPIYFAYTVRLKQQ